MLLIDPIHLASIVLKGHHLMIKNPDLDHQLRLKISILRGGGLWKFCCQKFRRGKLRHISKSRNFVNRNIFVRNIVDESQQHSGNNHIFIIQLFNY